MIVVELGRRVPFDFDKYGHTPSCLDRGDQELSGKPAVVQVYYWHTINGCKKKLPLFRALVQLRRIKILLGPYSSHM